MPGRHVTDRQMRLFMKHRMTAPVSVAAARAGFSAATGYRIEQDPRLPSERHVPRERRRPDPLADVFEAEMMGWTPLDCICCAKVAACWTASG